MKLNTSLALKPKLFFYILIGMVWCQTILMQYLRAVIMRFPIIGTAPDEVLTFLYIAIILLSISEIKFHMGDFIGILSMLLIFLISPIVFPDTFVFWKEEYTRFLLQVFPLYIIGVSIGNHKDDWDNILHILYILSVVSIIVRIVYYYTNGTEMSQIQSLYAGDMDGAYNLLPHLCLVIYHVIKKATVFNVSVLAVGSVFLMFLGTRGAVLIEIICFVLVVLFFAKWKYKVLKIVLISTAVIVFLYSPLLEKTVLELYKLADGLGLSVRIFDHFLNGELTDSTGRDVIANTLYEFLSENSLGYGLYADRLLAGGAYAHKIYLELWIQFGVILGTIIFAFILIVPVRAFFKTKNDDIKGLLIALYCSGVLKLFLSSSYLREGLFFMLLGLSVSTIRIKEKCEK